MGINGEHTSHHRFLLQYLLSIRKIHLSGSAGWHFLLDHSPLNKPRVSRWLGRLGWLVLGTLLGIVAILATFETSARLVPQSLVRWDPLSLRLLGLHLLSGCTVPT